MFEIAGGIILAVGALVLGGLLLVNWRAAITLAFGLACMAVLLAALFLPR